MSTLKTNNVILGDSATDTQNFLLKTNADGSMKLARKSDGTGGDILTVDSAGNTAITGALNVGGGKLVTDAAGNLGLGVTPSAWNLGKAIELGSAKGNAVTGFGSNALVLLSNAYYNTSWLYANNGYANKFEVGAVSGQYQWFTAPSGTAGNAITFTQAMSLDASGNLLVKATGVSPTGNGFVVDVLAGGSFTRTQTAHAAGVTSGNPYSEFMYDGSTIGSITQNGTTAVAFSTTSDHRLKTNVRPANAARFMDIEFVDFEWVDGRHDCGVIADQLQSVYPDLVLGAKDATEVRQIEITPAVPAVTEQVLVTPAVEAVLDEDGNVVTEAVAAVYETVEVTPAVPAVTEEQTFPVYQQVNYMGLIGRMGTRVQQLQRTVDSQAALIAAMEARLTALEAA